MIDKRDEEHIRPARRRPRSDDRRIETVLVIVALSSCVAAFALIGSRASAEPAQAGRAAGGGEGAAEANAAGGNSGDTGAPYMLHGATFGIPGGATDGGGLALFGQPVTGVAENAEFKIVVGALHHILPPLFGDFDRNFRVDILDYDNFAACISGPDQVAPAGCTLADADEDADTDLRDTAEFLRAFTSPRF